MIRYALLCDQDHTFEAWFSSSDDFEDQRQRELVQCPFCESSAVHKQIMAPAIQGAKKSASAETPAQAFAEFASKVREKIRNTHDYVGEEFADKARAMHLGETPEKAIYGEVSVKQAKELQDEGVPAELLPEPFSPGKPKKIN
jgi:hypothetical protein